MVCLITGASSGIGAALARELAGRGAKLALAARRREKLEALDADLGGGHLVLVADVGVPEDCERIVRRTQEHFGRLDTLIANAGYGISKATDATTSEEMRKMFAVNVFGTHDCARAAVEVMRHQPVRDGFRGQLMFTSSGAARRGIPFGGPYSATKAAQLSLAEAMRVELADDGIAVTSVHPVGTATEFFDISEREGTIKVQGIGPRSNHQSAEHVARRMVRAIEKPVREVWPARSVRYLLGVNSVLPSIGDLVMRRIHRQIRAAQ